MSENPSMRDRFSGCIIGQCLGDAMGLPVEGSSFTICQNYVKTILRGGRYVENKYLRHNFGQYTDDSQLARELMISLVNCRGFAADDYAGRLLDLFSQMKIVGIGNATMQAMLRLQRGYTWQSSGEPAPMAGNGTAMRTAPIGLFYYDSPEELKRSAVMQGFITHQDERCSAGSVLIARAVAEAVQTDKIDRDAFIEELAVSAAEYSYEFAKYVENLSEWADQPPETAVEYIAAAGRDTDFIDSWHKISPFVIPSVLWSLYSFLRSPEDYWETICTAIACGGDVDTTAAMAGAVSGAYNGLSGIPAKESQLVNDDGEWGYEELVSLSQDLYDIKHGIG